MARLPVPGQDDGVWGDLLNDYLLESHKADGSIRDDAVDGAALANNSVTESALNVTNSPTSGQFLSWNGSGLVWATSSGSGVTDHGALTGLGDDDHTQYHNNARGDARYYTQAQIDLALDDKADTSAAVLLSGSQTVTGAKDFTGGLTSNGTAVVVTNDSRLTDNRTPVNNSVSSAKIQTDAVTTLKIANLNVTTAKLGDSSVTEPKLAINNSASNGDHLGWDGTSLTWISPNATSTALDDLSDVDVAGATDAQALVYQSGTWIPATVSGGGVTDHGALTGLTDDDHPQYHNNARGDARYYTQSQIDTALGDKSDIGHVHNIDEVNNLQESLDVKVDTSDSRLSDNRTPLNNSVTTVKIVDGQVTPAKLSFDPATQIELDAHISDASAAHAASAISFNPTGTVSATNVQAAIAEVAAEAGGGISDGDKGDITVSGSGAVWTIDNSVITNAKVSGSAAIDQSKISGLTSDLALKANLASPTFTGTLTVPTVKITSGSPGSGKVLTSDADGDATWQTPSGGGGGDAFVQASKALVRFQIGSTTDIEARDNEGGILSLGSTHATVIQAAIDYVKDNGGGDVMIAAGVYNITTPILGRTVDTGSSATTAPVWIRGAGDLWTPPFASGTPFGTVLKWTGGSNSGALLDLSSDCHGYRVSNLTITGQSSIRDCIRIAGAHARIHDCTIVNPNGGLTQGAAIRVTNGSDASQDRYVGVKIHACMIRTAVAGAWGIYVESPNSGSNSTDGGISNSRIICSGGAGGGFASINSGGWVISGECHFTGNASTTNGLVMGSSFANVSGVYIDVVGNGPSVVLGGNQISFMNNHIACDNKTGTSHSAIDVSGSSITIMGNTFSAAAASEVDYFVHETGSSDRVVVSGNIGTSLVVAVSGFTNFVNGGSIYVAGNVGT